jgi:predicted nucleic acid-binding protein
MEVAISVATLAELESGVEMAADAATRRQRSLTLAEARKSAPLPVDERVASEFACLVAALRKAGVKKPSVQDCYIAATAIVEGVAVCTQNGDFDLMPPHARALSVIRVCASGPALSMGRPVASNAAPAANARGALDTWARTTPDAE